MIKILDQFYQLKAILHNVESPLINEEINGPYTFEFSTVIDTDKSQYINYQNIVEVEGNYFNIVYYKKNRNTDDTTTIDVQCEHKSYDLLEGNNILEEGFTAYGTSAEIMAQLLQGTPFTVGTVEITSQNYISVNEQTNKREVMLLIAKTFNGELKYNKLQVSLLIRRGADRGVQFRYRKNLLSCSYIVDNRKKVNGLPKVSVDVDVAELEFANGGMPGEHYELGDTVTVIEPDMGVNIPARIVKESHNPNEHMKGNVNISNVIEDISDTITQMQQKAVYKESVYNGCKIGPENGFEAIRSDKKAKATMNATEGYKLETGDGNGSYTPVFYIVIEQDGKAKLYLGGNAVFSGKVSAADIEGSDITGGTINVQTDLHVGDNIYLGNISSVVVKKIIFNEHTNFETIPESNGLRLNFGVLEFVGSIKGGWYFGGATDVSGLETFGYATQNGINLAIADHVAQYHT